MIVGHKFAQKFREKVSKVYAVADVGKEFFVLFLVEVPIYIVQFGVVEFVFNLLPNVVEDIFALFGRTVVEFRII